MNARQVEKKVNAIIDEILNEDQENDFATGDEACPGGCEKLDDTPKECKCGVETSLRFSLRVMEAMRLLQRDVDQPITFSAEEIADYIRSHYHYNGDLYAQVRTALRQVCSQGFVMELLDNEYRLVGPVVRPIKRNGCSLDRIIKDTSRRRKKVDDQRNSVCDCARFPKSPRQDLRSPREESRRTFIVDRPEDSEPIFHSTRISANERDDADRRREFDTVSDIQDYRRRRDIEMEQRDRYAEPIPEPSRKVLRISSSDPARNAKKARVKDQRVERADEKEDETTTKEEDMDCTCNAEIVTRDKLARIRPPDRPRVIRNERRRNDAEEDEEDIEERIKDDEEDEDTEDSIYDELRARVPHRRTAARERELRRWIRRCREECERRGRR